MILREALRGIFSAGLTIYTGLGIWAEIAHGRSNRRMLGTGGDPTGHEAIVVLGYGNRGPRANMINRYRVRAGIRSRDPRATGSTIVFCGGTVMGAEPEAVIMERFAREELGFTGRSVLETESRSTRENIANAIGFIEHADAIKIVSNSPHAEVARELLWTMRPDIADRLVRADEHILGEITPIKIGAALRAVAYRRAQRRR
ncbi:YdcF family protein [uncultured Microbacterium sp.]|uniref:YdcF family protein n=1 Tax=uncultured Microbacterium sp. TaxID=191216 RepID=UPI0026075C54|nr:YdcF family protein [uncultured Microbacterium sp.]